MQRTWIILVLFIVIIPLAAYADINDYLVEAAEEGQIQKVKDLIESGADVNAEDRYGRKALIRAAGWGSYTETVQVLLDAGADVNAKDKYGRTALMKAANYGPIEKVELLIQI